MLRPEYFSIEYEASRNMPYGIEEQAHPNMLTGGGVLKKGELVWLKEAPTGGSTAGVIPAFVEHLGVILLEARFLVDYGHHRQ
jgi:hypothetical protein